MSISGVGASTSSYLTQVKSATQASFAANPTSTTTTATTGATSDTATISAAAQAIDVELSSRTVLSANGIQGAGPAYSEAFFHTINSLRGQDEVNAYTEAAGEVSAAQGLPPGQFDFSHITRGQAEVVANYLGQTHQINQTEMNGMLNGIPWHSRAGENDWTNETFDARTGAAGGAAYEAAKGNAAGAASYQAGVDMIDRLESLWKGQMQAKAMDDTDKLTSLIDASRTAIAA